MKQLVGTGVALVTPFHENGTIDVKALTRIVNYCIEGNVDYLVVLGTTGESVTLNKDEKQLVVDTVIDSNSGRLPLVLGVGGNNTAAIIDELNQLDLSAFDAILSVSPYYNRPTQEGIYQHFKAIASATTKQIVLYNVPGRTSSNILPETAIRLAVDFENIVAIKEASGNMVQVMQLIKDKPKNFQVISGDDITALPTILAGGVGVISVLGQGLPFDFSNMVRLALNKECDAAYGIHYNLQEGMELIFQEGNPAGIKAIFEAIGLSTAAVRLPLVEASSQLKTRIGTFVKPFQKVHF